MIAHLWYIDLFFIPYYPLFIQKCLILSLILPRFLSYNNYVIDEIDKGLQSVVLLAHKA